jgi:two-component system CheB/CheR fusion protein
VLFVPSQANVATAPKQRLENRLEAASEGDTERFIRQLQHDFSFTRLYLQSLLEERDVRNQELISANEEIQAANEDLQSTNEELQSSNEELQTVNDELQNRNIVLTQDSTDLENLLNSLSTPVVLLSRDFKIRHFTPQTQRLMNLHPSDIGRGFDDIRLNLKIEKLEPLFAEVLDTLTPRELEVQDRDGHWYLLRIRPYRTADNKIDGLVVALVNIDQLQGLRNASEFARSIIDSIPFPLVVVDCDFRIRTTNEAFCNLADSKDRIVEGRVLTDLAAVRWGIQQPLRSLLETVKRDRGASKSFEFEHDMKDGGAKVILVRARPLKPDGEASLLVTFEDVTAHKEVERLLKAKSERLASKVATTTRELDRSREELRALAGSLLTTQEDERRRLARELHDDISQRLAALNIAGDQVVATIATNAGEARRKLEAALKQIGQLSEDVRMLSHRLHPSIIEDLGLKAALRSLTQEFGEREEMITTFFAQDVPEMVPLEVATAVYRIAQEALRNIAKHAGKTHVKVQLIGLTVALELQVTDSGKGFNLEQNASGLGLISMKERARLIGAILQVRSAPREGTRVTLQVPLAAAAL